MTKIGNRVDETGMLVRDGGGSALRRDSGGRYRLDLHRVPVDEVEKRGRITGVLIANDLVDVDGVATASPPPLSRRGVGYDEDAKRRAVLSVAEALERQSLFVNRIVASHALGLQFDLLARGSIGDAGAFINLASGQTAPIPLPG